jgi:hypothetical protein
MRRRQTMPDPIVPDVPNEGDQKPSGAEKRINQLYGRAKAAEENVSQLQARLEHIEQDNQDLRRQVLMGQTQKPTEETPALPGTEIPLTGASDIKGVVRGEIKEALQEFQNQSKAERYQDAMMASWKESLRQAASLEPSLQDPNSAMYQHVDHVLKTDQGLQADPNGPLKALYIVRGAGSFQEVDPAKKAAATVPTGAGAISTSGNQAEIEELTTKLANVVDRQKRSDGDPMQLWREFRSTKMALAKAKGEDLGPVVSKPAWEK